MRNDPKNGEETRLRQLGLPPPAGYFTLAAIERLNTSDVHGIDVDRSAGGDAVAVERRKRDLNNRRRNEHHVRVRHLIGCAVGNVDAYPLERLGPQLRLNLERRQIRTLYA